MSSAPQRSVILAVLFGAVALAAVLLLVLTLDSSEPGSAATAIDGDDVAGAAARATNRTSAAQERERFAPRDGADAPAQDEVLTQEQRRVLAPLAAAVKRAILRKGENAALGVGRPWPVNKDGIQGAVNERKPELKECYEAWSQLNPELAGKLVVSFRIEANPDDPNQGVVAAAEVKDDGVGHHLMNACVLATLSNMSFEAPPPDGLSVTYPFAFTHDAAQDATAATP